MGKLSPPTFTSRQKRDFRRKVRSYSLNGSKLTRAGQEVLHENNIEDTLRHIHEADLDHTGDCKVLQQKCLAQYRAENFRGYCQDVTVTCTKCKEERMVILDIVTIIAGAKWGNMSRQCRVTTLVMCSTSSGRSSLQVVNPEGAVQKSLLDALKNYREELRLRDGGIPLLLQIEELISVLG